MNRVPVVIEPAAKSDIRAVRDYYSKAACSAQPDSWDPSHELHLAIIRSAEQIAVRLSVEIDQFANRHPPAQLQTLNTRTQPG